MMPYSGPPTEAADWTALARYLAGESPRHEADEIERRIASEPRFAEVVTSLREALTRVGPAEPEVVDVERAWRSLAARLDDQTDDETMVAVRSATALPKRGRLRVGMPHVVRQPATRWAAVALAVAASVLLIWRGLDDRSAAAARTLVTAAGARDSTLLEDGTRVLLGPATTLRIAAGYDERHRDVTLEGEAYFVVRHDESLPFVVRAAGAVVRVIGTAFSVRAVEPGGRVRVAVTEGSVLLRASAATGDSGIVLREGQQGVVEPGGPALVALGGRTADALAWTQGRLVFRDTPLAQVAVELRRWYALDVRFADTTLAGRHLTASFAGEPATQVLEAISLALDVRAERRDSTIVILRSDASTQQPPR